MGLAGQAVVAEEAVSRVPDHRNHGEVVVVEVGRHRTSLGSAGQRASLAHRRDSYCLEIGGKEDL